jgi:hypothetical protein
MTERERARNVAPESGEADTFRARVTAPPRRNSYPLTSHDTTLRPRYRYVSGDHAYHLSLERFAKESGEAAGLCMNARRSVHELLRRAPGDRTAHSRALMKGLNGHSATSKLTLSITLGSNGLWSPATNSTSSRWGPGVRSVSLVLSLATIETN